MVKEPSADELAVLAEFGQSPRAPKIAPLDEGQVLLLVISPSGRTYTRRAQLDETTGVLTWPLPKPVAVAAADDASELGDDPDA